MDVISKVGFLDLTPEQVETFICTDPITDHFDVELTPFARGKFAAVRRVRCLRTGEYYAAKVVRKRRRARDVRYETLHEAAVLALARDNPKIIQLHRVFEGPSEMTLILELASGGELQRVIDEEERIEERVVRKYLKHILTALRFLHSNNIAHLDLKPQNLLLTGPHPGSDVKLCDFGISRVLLANIEVREVMGTPDYVAPEILQYEPISLATDMWSVGVLAYVLLTGHSPFGGDTKQETFLNISQCQLDFPDDIFAGVSSSAKEFISRLLVVEPGCRLTVDEAMLHPWLSPASPLSSIQNNLSPVHNEDENDTSHSALSLKRSSSPPKVIVSNKENNRNILNSFKDPVSTSGTSPPSKRECREPKEGTSEMQSHRSVVEVCLSPSTKPTHISSPHSSPKPQRTPNKERGRVSKQIRSIEMKLNKTNSKEDIIKEIDTVDAIPQPPSVSTLKAKFSDQIDIQLNSLPRYRRNNLNKSFGSVDQHETKEKLKENLRLSPLCLLRQENKYELPSPNEHKYGARRDFQDLVIKNEYIY